MGMKGGWVALVILLIAYLFIPSVPAVRAFLPIPETAVLLFPAIAVCTMLGWAAGGSRWLAIVWILIGAGALVLLPGVGTTTTYANAQRGWVLVTVASFGLISSASPYAVSFFVRAMTGLLLALTVCTAILVVTHSRIPVLPLTRQQMAPAILSLESMGALTLAWAVYHRVARAPIGPPLGGWQRFQFNDRYMWALLAGVIFLYVPAFISVRTLGLNLVVFFGTLYAVRLIGMVAYRGLIYSSRLRAG